MASRGTIKTWIRAMLGLQSDDPLADDAVLDPIVQQAVDSLVAALMRAAPDAFTASVSVPLSSTSHTYLVGAAANGVLDQVRAVRLTDADGARLAPCSRDDLEDVGSGYYALEGTGAATLLVTSEATEEASAVLVRYTAYPDELADDGTEVTGVPERFHDVVALEALFAFALGAEQRRPPELGQRWLDRRGQMLASASRPSAGPPSRTRLVVSGEPWP